MNDIKKAQEALFSIKATLFAFCDVCEREELKPILMREIKKIRKCLIDAPISEGGLVEGVVIVPIEPTDAMIDAWNEEIQIIHATGLDPETHTYHDCHEVTGEIRAYKAMIAAAQAPK